MNAVDTVNQSINQSPYSAFWRSALRPRSCITIIEHRKMEQNDHRTPQQYSRKTHDRAELVNDDAKLPLESSDV